MPASERRDGLSFGKNVPAIASGEQKHQVDRAGSIERVELRIYTGAELDLDLELYVDPTEGNRRAIVELEGKTTIDGDDDKYVWHPSHPFEEDDEIVVKFENQDTNNDYDYRVNMDIDYRNKIDRLRSALTGLV